MTYHQMIQRLNTERMADVLCSFLDPWVGNVSAEQKEMLRQQLLDFLNSEVKKK